MLIDVVSDTVCPWCYIGKKRLERAVAMRPGLGVQVRWRPYRLDPTIPPEGIDRRAYLKAKFGDNPRSRGIGEAIRAEGARDGISFAFDRIGRSPNTLDSHRLIRWADTAGCQDTVVERIFAAYFLDGRDIGDRAVLVEIAEQSGMDAALVAELLETGADASMIEREDLLAHEMGITGVPTFIFDNRFMLSGAQEPQVLVRVMEKAVSLATGEAPGQAAT